MSEKKGIPILPISKIQSAPEAKFGKDKDKIVA